MGRFPCWTMKPWSSNNIRSAWTPRLQRREGATWCATETTVIKAQTTRRRSRTVWYVCGTWREGVVLLRRTNLTCAGMKHGTITSHMNRRRRTNGPGLMYATDAKRCNIIYNDAEDCTNNHKDSPKVKNWLICVRNKKGETTCVHHLYILFFSSYLTLWGVTNLFA